MTRPTAKDITLLSIIPTTASVTLTLPYPPSVNRIWRSGQRRGKTVVYRADEYKQWVAEAHIAWLKQRHQLIVKSLKGWYSITILAHPPDRRNRDLGNLEKVVSDFLQMVAVIENDSLTQEIILRWNRTSIPSNSIHVTVSPYP